MTHELEAMLDPTGSVGGGAQARLAPRSGVLRHARIGLVNSTKPNSAVFLEQVGALLQERYELASVSLFDKATFALPLDDALATQVAERCDYAIAGIGD